MSSDELFSKNKVTVVNFWFSTCKPCVEELGDLDALNKELAEKGGEIVGVNSYTLDGDETAISDAKGILSKKGATYRNIWFGSETEPGQFTAGLFSFPTTYVVDQRQHRGPAHHGRHHLCRAEGSPQQAHRPGACKQRGVKLGRT